MSTKKDFQSIRKSAEKQGFQVKLTNSGHLKWYAPNGVDVIVSGSTESDPRGIKNHLARLRKAGYNG